MQLGALLRHCWEDTGAPLSFKLLQLSDGLLNLSCTSDRKPKPQQQGWHHHLSYKKKTQVDLHLCPDTSVHRPGMISVAVHHIRRNSHHLYRYVLVENLNHQHGCHVQSLYLFHCFACLHKILSHLNPLKYFNSKTFPSHSQCATF